MLKTKDQGGILEIQPEDLKENLKGLRLIDVRRPDEYTGDLGHIKGTQLVTLGPDLLSFLEKAEKNSEIVFVCRSGGRSGQATMVAKSMGFEKAINMTGGMLRWNELKFPTEK